MRSLETGKETIISVKCMDINACSQAGQLGSRHHYILYFRHKHKCWILPGKGNKMKWKVVIGLRVLFLTILHNYLISWGIIINTTVLPTEVNTFRTEMRAITKAARGE